MKPFDRVGSHIVLTFFHSLWYMDSVLADPYLWCSCASSLILLLDGAGESSWARLRGSVGRMLKGGGGGGLFGLFCGGWLMCLAVFLAMLSAASLPMMLLCAGTLMMWMGLWGGMFAMASRMHEVRCL